MSKPQCRFAEKTASVLVPLSYPGVCEDARLAMTQFQWAVSWLLNALVPSARVWHEGLLHLLLGHIRALMSWRFFPCFFCCCFFLLLFPLWLFAQRVICQNTSVLETLVSEGTLCFSSWHFFKSETRCLSLLGARLSLSCCTVVWWLHSEVADRCKRVWNQLGQHVFHLAEPLGRKCD